MKPYSVSASSLKVADLCLARYAAENIGRAPQLSNNAADLGTTLHSALEDYVRLCFIDRTAEPKLEMLLNLYKLHYTTMFDSNYKSAIYKDGLKMANDWWARSGYLSDTEIISCEQKNFFPIELPDKSKIKFNYIWDRCDRVGENAIKVVDYKSVSRPISADDMRAMIQPRAYALAAAIQFKDMELDYVDVEFDLLRYDRVGVRFTREDNIATWRWIQKLVKTIWKTSAERAPETLNSECGYCVRKLVCKKLNSHQTAGGVVGIDIQTAAQRKADIANQMSGLRSLEAQLDDQLLKHAHNEDVLEFETDDHKIKLAVTKRREIDGQRAAAILPAEVLAKYGKIGVTELDKLRDELSPELVKQLDSLVNTNYSDPKVKVIPKVTF